MKKAMLGSKHRISAYILLFSFSEPSAEGYLHDFMVRSDKASGLEKGVEACGDAEFLANFSGILVDTGKVESQGRGFGKGAIVA